MPTARTTVESLTGAVYAISAALPATYDAAGYNATSMVYVPIGEVETVTPYGSARTVNIFAPITGPKEKTKGTPDYGNADLVYGDVPLDPGQVIVKAADASPNHYSLKITYADGEKHFLDVLVNSYVYSGGKEGDPKTVTAKLAICKAPVIVAAP